MENRLYKPTSFYRMQFHTGFTFADAQNTVPYLQELGISHVYTSPVLAARPGSTHGYDIVDHRKLNPELGGREGFNALSSALSAAGIGLVMDIVPNHMGIGFADNAWWLDVLEWGRCAEYAHYFDIDWFPETRGLRNKVLLPVLGDLYGSVLENGEFRLSFDAETGAFNVFYYEHRFPVCPATYGRILSRCLAAAEPPLKGIEEIQAFMVDAEKLRRCPPSASGRKLHRIRGNTLKKRLVRLCFRLPEFRSALEKAEELFSKNCGDGQGLLRLHKLLEVQNYRPAFWRVAGHEINYRRFFQINDLAGLRVEEADVFEASHSLVRELIADGQVHGLRVDHIDGLYDPAQYLERLQEMAAPFADRLGFEKGRFPVYVEKILEEHETLRADWPVFGTTGYDALNEIGSVLLDPAGVSVLNLLFEEREGTGASDVETGAVTAKKAIMDRELAAELEVLANETVRLLKKDPLTRDFTRSEIRQALREIASHFPVYRTYVGPGGPSAEDERDLDWAIGIAHKARAVSHSYLFDVLEALLKGRLFRGSSGRPSAECLRLARKFQQFTGPVMAKGVEDTAFYRTVPLVSMNEVGGGPGRKIGGPVDFHPRMFRRNVSHPLAMVTTATHDTKRSDDVRARISVLSETPEKWAEHLARWQVLNRRARLDVKGSACPSSLDEYLFYQTLLGVWPHFETEPDDWPAGSLTEMRERVEIYMIKASREAKIHTSWLNPDEGYETCLRDFVSSVIDGQAAAPFLRDFDAFARTIEIPGARNALSQLVLRLTVPGVPDTYQGTEFWDDSLVDPDNRRDVDYDKRIRGVEALMVSVERDGEESLVRELRETWWDGRIKLYILWRLLNLRRENPDLFLEGDYRPLETAGEMESHVLGFMRSSGEKFLMVTVPRLTYSLGSGFSPEPSAWKDTAVPAGGDAPGTWKDVLTGRVFRGSIFACRDLFSSLPVAVFISEST
jgi:(1->4)-alpha-D-glucan 1-alpha-D-glucosylmutase